jgi:hypothetical protein
MATDKTPPQNRLIATIALIALCTLVALKFILTSYFDEMIDADRKSKRSKPEELYAVRAEQQKSLESSPMPIDQAMKAMTDPSRSDLITPKQSDDTGPLLGWSKSPKALPKVPAPIAPPPDLTPAITDAGVGDAAVGDGGKPKNAPAAMDGGAAPHHTAPLPAVDGGAGP